MRIDRLLGIVVLLLNRERISARLLADKFEVSIRTIYRDIESINMAGIPIISHAGNNGGFGIMDNYKIDRQVLSLNEMISIVTALKGVSSTITENDYDNVSEKILSLVPDDKKQEMQERFEELIIDIVPWGYKEIAKTYIKEIQQAISNKKLIRFKYRNNRQEEVTRIVEPMTLVFKGYAWYLFGYCKKRSDYRIFKLVRMNELITTHESFKRRNSRYQEFMKLPVNTTNKVDLVLWYSKEVMPMVEEYYDESCINYNNDGSAVVKLSLPEDEWLYSILLSSGENVKVIKPEHIAKKIKERAKKILANYEHDITLSNS